MAKHQGDGLHVLGTAEQAQSGSSGDRQNEPEKDLKLLDLNITRLGTFVYKQPFREYEGGLMEHDVDSVRVEPTCHADTGKSSYKNVWR